MPSSHSADNSTDSTDTNATIRPMPRTPPVAALPDLAAHKEKNNASGESESGRSTPVFRADDGMSSNGSIPDADAEAVVARPSRMRRNLKMVILVGVPVCIVAAVIALAVLTSPAYTNSHPRVGRPDSTGVITGGQYVARSTLCQQASGGRNAKVQGNRKGRVLYPCIQHNSGGSGAIASKAAPAAAEKQSGSDSSSKTPPSRTFEPVGDDFPKVAHKSGARSKKETVEVVVKVVGGNKGQTG